MAYLFDESDFALFTQYKGKTHAEAPEGQEKLRTLYNKLGEILDGLKILGYHTEITRNPLSQAGPATMKYCSYHWSKIYPKEESLYQGCLGKVFFVIGSTEDGIDIHIDSNLRKGFNSDIKEVTKAIKDKTWLQIPPQDASKYSCDDYVKMVDNYIMDHRGDFYLFGKEFNIVECIKELNKMEMDNIKNLLKGNYNLILTGAPGTGKTFLAKKIAEAMGADEDSIKMVQFHPSYDYTDFVEGLRPIKEGNSLGFQRKDGVFKDFCKKAIKNTWNIDTAYSELINSIKVGTIKTLSTRTKVTAELKVKGDDNIYWYSEGEKSNISSNCISRERLIKLYSHYDTIEKFESMNNVQDGIKSVIGGCDSTYYWAVLNYILKNKSEAKPYVFIIDEINRGEISKIFGELFYSIDPGYRGEKGKVETQYQNLIPKEDDSDFDSNNPDVFRNGFYVPENVYIIGSMNDIDRSVESMDFAMRRRFAWKEITAKSRQSMLDEDDAWKPYGKPSEEMIAEMKARMDNLNAAIVDQYGDEGLRNKDKVGLTKAYQIGAAYFLKYALYNDFEELWTNHLEGLLREYQRGKTNVDEKIERLHQAYNDITAH